MFANLDDTFTGSQIYGDDFNVAYSPVFPSANYGYTSLNGGAHQNEYVMNINLMWLPTKTFTITPSLRVQEEDWNANSAGPGTLGTRNPGLQQQQREAMPSTCVNAWTSATPA